MSNLRREIRCLEDQTTRQVAEIARLQFRVAELEGENTRLVTELNQKKGIKQNIRELYQSVDVAIIARIDKKGLNKPVNGGLTTRHIKISESTREAEKLIQIAREYDTHAYFKLNSPSSPMGFRYRLLSKTYRLVRDGLKSTAKIIYRVIRKAA